MLHYFFLGWGGCPCIQSCVICWSTSSYTNCIWYKWHVCVTAVQLPLQSLICFHYNFLLHELQDWHVKEKSIKEINMRHHCILLISVFSTCSALTVRELISQSLKWETGNDTVWIEQNQYSFKSSGILCYISGSVVLDTVMNCIVFQTTGTVYCWPRVILH